MKSKSSTLIITIISSVLLILMTKAGLWWISVGLSFCILCFLLMRSSNNVAIFVRTKKYVKYPLIIAGIFLATIATKIFIFEIYSIKGNSMEGTISNGDKVLVCKLNYGPVLPRSPFDIPWINLLFYMNKGFRERINEKWWPYKRLSGFGAISVNDIITFKSPLNESNIIIKRCIGLPGDTISIRDKNVFINKQKLGTPIDVKFSYNVYPETTRSFNSLFIQLPFGSLPILHKEFKPFNTNTSLKNKKIIFSSPSTKSELVVYANTHPIQGTKIFKVGKRWTLDNFGPLFIPAKGTKINITDDNFDLYEGIIKKYENCTITNTNKGYVCNGKTISHYTFKKDYFFVLGDNRSTSYDSRIWGFVPEECIIGKVLYRTKINFTNKPR